MPSRNTLRLRSDEPPFPRASTTAAFHSDAARRAPPAASPSRITSSTRRLTSAARSTPSPPTSARAPTRHSHSTSHAFIRWSDIFGTHTIGTPHATLSITEFHPQCVTKQPTAACNSTRTWSHHSTTMPFLSGASISVSDASPSASSALMSFRTTHRYGLPVSSSPRSSSSSCSLSILARLPNATYTTESAGLASSHSMYLTPSCLKRPASSPDGSTGPIGSASYAPTAASAPSSSSWHVLTSTVALGVSLSSVSNRSRTVVYTLWKKSDGSVDSVRKDGRSRTACGGRPGNRTRNDGSWRWSATTAAWPWK
ncbi:hypothetical protein CFC21_103704 [Triticum aestivum]|uniref:Uncharacterized protein n=2 Tax=Triticum aestivum TaxID=4565 RepID=A0A3B6SME7_WHEAT|nr:hypothetical protein CFC21_103704 [Triticum aestivum]